MAFWNCPICTLENANPVLNCKACGKSKPSSPSSVDDNNNNNNNSIPKRKKPISAKRSVLRGGDGNKKQRKEDNNSKNNNNVIDLLDDSSDDDNDKELLMSNSKHNNNNNNNNDNKKRSNNSNSNPKPRVPPQHSVSINNLSDRQYCCVWDIEPLKDGYRPDVARALLARVARHVNPILRERGWRVKRLIEMTSSKYAGLCVSNGRNDADAASTNIKLNLRIEPNKSCTKFKSFQSILSVMLHEITHTAIGLEDIHPPAFWELLNNIKKQYKDKLQNGEVAKETSINDYGLNEITIMKNNGQPMTLAQAASDYIIKTTTTGLSTTEDDIPMTTKECGVKRKNKKGGRQRFKTTKSSGSGGGATSTKGGGGSDGTDGGEKQVKKEKKKRPPRLKGSKMIDGRTKAAKEAKADQENFSKSELAARAALSRFSGSNSGGGGKITTTTVAKAKSKRKSIIGKSNRKKKKKKYEDEFSADEKEFIELDSSDDDKDDDDDNNNGSVISISSSNNRDDRDGSGDSDDDEEEDEFRMVFHKKTCACRSCQWDRDLFIPTNIKKKDNDDDSIASAAVEVARATTAVAAAGSANIRRLSSSPPPALLPPRDGRHPIIHPLTPRADHRNSFVSSLKSSSTNNRLCTSNNQQQKSNCVLYLCCTESTKEFGNGLERCKSACTPWQDIHDTCFQYDGTRHIKLWQGELGVTDVNKMIEQSQQGSVLEKLPSSIDFNKGWTDMRGGNHIGVRQQSVHALRHITLEIMDGILGAGRDNNGILSCDHLSLYQKRGNMTIEKRQAFATVRTALEQHDWGSLQVHSIRLKIKKTPYNECKVLIDAGAIATTTSSSTITIRAMKCNKYTEEILLSDDEEEMIDVNSHAKS